MEVLSHARKAQSAAFVASEGLLVVWDDGKSPNPIYTNVAIGLL